VQLACDLIPLQLVKPTFHVRAVNALHLGIGLLDHHWGVRKSNLYVKASSLSAQTLRIHDAACSCCQRSVRSPVSLEKLQTPIGWRLAMHPILAQASVTTRSSACARYSTAQRFTDMCAA
jgi:hypothetical protein